MKHSTLLELKSNSNFDLLVHTKEFCNRSCDLQSAPCQEVWRKPLKLLYSTLVCTQAPFFGEKMMSYVMVVKNHRQKFISFFLQKTDRKIFWYQIDFQTICNFFWSNHFRSGVKQKFLCTDSMSILDQNGRIQSQPSFTKFLSPHFMIFFCKKKKKINIINLTLSFSRLQSWNPLFP